MPRGINKVILIGNLGQDPEVRYMPNGNAVTNVTVATSDSWKDRETGQQQERTEWHRVVFFGKLAEVAGQYLSKGSKVYVEGALRTRKWQDGDGQDHYTTEIVVDMNGQMQMLDTRADGKQSGKQQDYGDSSGKNHAASNQQPANHPPQGGQYGGGVSKPQSSGDFDNFDDDIPF